MQGILTLPAFCLIQANAGASGSGPKQVPVTAPEKANQDDPKGKRPAAPAPDDAIPAVPAAPGAAAIDTSDSDAAAAALVGGLAVDGGADDASMEAAAVEGFVVVPTSAPVTPEGEAAGDGDDAEGMQE